MDVLGENAIHEVELESQSDAITGDPIRVEYVPVEGGETIVGDSATGVSKGSVMSFESDFAQLDISPGVYEIEFVRGDDPETRQMGLVGERDNRFTIEVTDAASI